MAFDGTTIAAVRKELSDSILGGRIYKIAQPEPDELSITQISMARISRRTKWLRISLNALEISQPDSSGAGCPASSGSIEKSRLPDLPYRKMACDRKSIAERYGY